MADEYLAQFRKSDADPYEATLKADREFQAMAKLRATAKPDVAAKANALARETGLPHATVERNMDTVKRQRDVQQFIGLTQKYPALINWGNNPRNAAVAVDDWEKLSNVGKAFRVIEKAPSYVGGRLLTGVVAATQSVYGIAQQAFKASDTYNPGSVVQRYLFGSSIDGNIADYFDGLQKEGGRLQTTTRPISGNYYVDGIGSGIESLPLMIGGGVAAATKGAAVGSAVFGASTAGTAAIEARDAGLPIYKSIPYGVAQGAIEAAGELIGPGKFVADIVAKTPIAKTILNFAVRELPSEQATTILQDWNEWGALHPEKTIGQFLEERPEAAAQTLLATIGGVGGASALAASVKVGAKLSNKVSSSIAARNQSKFLESLSNASQETQTRGRDPEAFANLVAALAADTDAENVYIPAEKVRELFQDDSWQEDPFWGPYENEIFEASATSGDIVIPIGDAMAHLPGTAIWDSIKGDIRLSAGGQSLNEVDAFEAGLSDEMADMADTIDAEAKAERAAMEPRAKLEETITKSLTDAGQSLDVSRKQAALTAAFYATRAERLGVPLTGREFDTITVNRVLPPALAAALPREPAASLKRSIKPIVDAMRGGASSSSKRKMKGDSLLNFITKRGGIDDIGGDVASMGAATMKGYAGKGKRKLIRKTRSEILASGGLSLGDNTFDEMAFAAWDAGYFPDLSERPSTREFLEAIGNSLSGNDLFVPDAEDVTALDQTKMAADDLRELLDREGLDPDAASDTDIIAAINRFEARQSDGFGFDQSLPDTIDIDGVQRPTLNSKGQRIAATEEATRNFWAWFGDSKVVDERGRPLVVYHGTRGDIDVFEKSRIGQRFEKFTIGIHFSSNANEASLYADSMANFEQGWRSDAPFAKEVEVGANVLPVYVRLGNPIKIDSGAKLAASYADDNRREIIMQIVESRRENPANELAVVNALLIELGEKPLDRIPTKKPYDGVVVSSSRGDKFDALNAIAFEPEQIKSVNNVGAFDLADARILYQEKRGSVRFNEGQKVIDLFNGSDRSTFIHEMGHIWLEDLQADASLETAPESLKADWETVTAWFKANGHEIVDGIIPVEAHELWARGIERYTMEGKAPSTRLQAAFKAFQSWMLKIYQVVENLRSPISPEIRDVMDRLFATESEIKAANETQRLTNLFETAEAAAAFGMNDKAYAEYTATATEARDEAFNALLFKTMEAVRRRITKENRDERKEVEVEVAAEIDSQPVFRALKLLRSKDGPRIDRVWITQTYGVDVVNQIPQGVPPIVSKEGVAGTNADMIAEMSGFATGGDMVKALVGLQDRRKAMKEGDDTRSVRQSFIDDGVNAIMTDRYGDVLSDGSIEQEALSLIHNEKQGERIATELRALGRATNKKPTPYRYARMWAKDKIRSGVVRDVASGAAIQQYLRAAAKAGRAARDAYLAQDIDGAYKHTQALMLNNALVAEAKAASTEIEATVKRMAKMAKRRTIKTMDQDYLERIHELLERVDLKQRSQVEIDRVGSFAEWATAQNELGHDIIVPSGFAETLGTVNWSRLKVDALLDLDAVIKQIGFLGRKKQIMLDNQEEREFDEIVSEAVDAAGNLNGRPPSELMTPDWKERIVANVASIDGMLLKIETICDWLDGGDSNGIFNRMVFRPMADAQERSAAMAKDYGQRISDLVQALPDAQRGKWRDKVSMPELINPKNGKPFVMTRMNMIAMALNMGNAGNIQRLVDGYGWQSEELVRTVLNREMSEGDWKFVADVWKVVDTLWPEIAALERRVNGVEPDRVEPVPFDTPFGRILGGYYPAVYDKTKFDRRDDMDHVGDSVFPVGYGRTTTRSSSTKQRSEKVSRPILLSLTVINRHITEVIHDITHREAIMDAAKFLSNGRVKIAVVDALNPQIYAQFKPWLQYVAGQHVIENNSSEGFLWWTGKMRANATFVGLGFRISTVKMQAAGMVNSQEVIGGTWLAQAAAIVSKNPLSVGQFVLEKSNEVRNRIDNLDRDIRANLLELEGRDGTLSEARRFAFHGIGYADRLVSVPTWLAAYNKAIAADMSDDDAVYAADKAVRQSQGSGAPKDLAAIMRGEGKLGELMKFLTMFGSYMNAKYQRDRTLYRDVRGADVERRPRASGELMARGFYLFVVAALLPLMIAGRTPDDDEGIEAWADWAWKGMLFALPSALPILRDAVPIATKRATDDKSFGYQMTPATGAVTSGINVAGDIGNIIEGEPTKRATRNALEFAGYVGAPIPGQVSAAAQFGVNVADGTETPDDVWQWLEGLEKGKIKEP